jgi:hypothetical protein
VRFTIARARVRGVAFRLDERRFVADLRPLLRLAELRLAVLRLAELRLVERFAELRLAELRLAELRLAELRLVELRLAVPRLAELRFAVRFDLPRAADLLRDDFFAAIDVCSCRGGWFKVPDSKIRAHNLRGVAGEGRNRPGLQSQTRVKNA